MSVMRKVREAVARNGAADTRLLIGMLGECSCTPSTPDEHLFHKELGEFLYRTFSKIRMSERDREVCKRVFFGEEKQIDVARDLGMPRQNVWRAIRNARVKLARALKRTKS